MLGLYYTNVVDKDDAVPAAAASIQTFGDFLGFNPHLHILSYDGCFGKGGMVYSSPNHINAEELEPLFRHKVLSMLKSKTLPIKYILII
ncbi:MAG: transposase [Actinobacteria bacterium]|nr:transposase [Actinomycetota bacterium]